MATAVSPGRTQQWLDEEYHGLACAVKSCSKNKDLEEAREIHGRITSSRYSRDRYLNNLLMDMYSKCGSLADVAALFAALPSRNQFSWNIMLAAYGRNGHLQDAERTFHSMPNKSVVAYNAMVAAYARSGNLGEARNLFDKTENKDVVSWTTLLTAYAENGHVLEARRIFDKMPDKNVVSWTAMMTGYIENQQLNEARRLFDTMPERNISSWNNMVKGYALHGRTAEARTVFDEMPQKNVISWTSMVTAYAQSGDLGEARSLFDSMPQKNIVSYNAMITAYSHSGRLSDAEKLFGGMTKRDPVTWTAMLTAYAQHGRIAEARGVFERMPQKVLVSWNAMITAYAQNGDLDSARRMFQSMGPRNVASWNAIISGSLKNGEPREALYLFRAMDLDGMHPNDITFMSVVDACADIQALPEGRILHSELLSIGTKLDLYLHNALLHMYGRCGSLAVARTLFEDMPEKDRWSWNVLISSYAHVGHTKKALELFALMALDGTPPDEVTFVGVLGACSHAGRVDLGCLYFTSMGDDFGLDKNLDHDLYVCLIDVLGRSGWLKEAEELISSMPFQPDSVAWATLLGSYRKYGNLKGAKRAANRVFQLDPEDSSPYVLLYNLYQSSQKRDGCDFREAVKLSPRGSFIV